MVTPLPAVRPPRQQGWVMVVVLVALAIVALLSRDALLRSFGAMTGVAEGSPKRLDARSGGPTHASPATSVPPSPVERARTVEGVVQQQADDLARTIDREAR
jgi:hypothetical protein